MKKAIIFLQLLWLLSIFFRIHADINDNFSDRDITLSPPWYGDTSYYQTDDSCRLWLSAFYESDKAYLVTKSNAIQDAVWQFTLWMEFNPSSSNYTRVYLVSDKDSLEKSLNGYFVEVGGSSDEISLYRQEGYKETEIIDGKNDR